jgi:hypothetical protein
VVAVIAFIGAAIPIVAQRRIWPTERVGEDTADKWWRWGLGAALVATVAWMIFGPAPQPAAIPPVIEDKTYTVTPAGISVKAGMVTGEITEMKVTERVEQGSGRVMAPARLTAKVVLKNSSAKQTLRLVGGKIRYLDAQGQPIKLEETRTEPALSFSEYGSSSDQLAPGQEAMQLLDVDFPAEALKAKRLKEIRLELVFLPLSYREETVHFNVSIGGQ